MLRPPPSVLRLFPAILVLGCAGFSDASGAEVQSKAAAPPPSPISTMREDVLRMSEFFDTMLPGTLSQYNIVMEVSPKFSDLRDNEFVRYPIELRYGLPHKWELFGGVSPFSPNPINSGFDHRWGLGEGRIGARRDVGRLPFIYDAVTVSFEVRTPLGQPPIEINDHYTHIRPSISTSRQLHWPHATFLTEYSYDRQVSELSRPPPGVAHRNILEIAPAVLYKPGEFGWFVNYAFRHFADDAGTHLGHEGKVGGIWDVPLARTARWGLPGKWQVELAYRYTTEEGLGSSQGVTARVHWRTTLREILSQGPN